MYAAKLERYDMKSGDELKQKHVCQPWREEK